MFNNKEEGEKDLKNKMNYACLQYLT